MIVITQNWINGHQHDLVEDYLSSNTSRLASYVRRGLCPANSNEKNWYTTGVVPTSDSIPTPSTLGPLVPFPNPQDGDRPLTRYRNVNHQEQQLNSA